MTAGQNKTSLKPLKLSCTQTDCANDLHCFLQKTRKSRAYGGPCRDCGKELVEFPRVHARNLDDVENTFEALSREWIRHEFWERSIDQRAINHARRKGRITLFNVAAPKRIRQAVGQARHPREGQQTPYEGNILYYAQHAVAACCRKCVEYWHGIPGGNPLTDVQIDYLTKLVLLYIDKRMPDLVDSPVRISPIRKAH
jgi:hypothetical protein